MEAEALPGCYGSSGELSVGLDESLVEEHGRIAGAGEAGVTELVAQCSTDDERDEFLGLAAGFAAEAGVDAQLSAGGVATFGVDVDMLADVDEVLALAGFVGLPDPVDKLAQSLEPRLDLRVACGFCGPGGKDLEFSPELGDVFGLSTA